MFHRWVHMFQMHICLVLISSQVIECNASSDIYIVKTGCSVLTLGGQCRPECSGSWQLSPTNSTPPNNMLYFTYFRGAQLPERVDMVVYAECLMPTNIGLW